MYNSKGQLDTARGFLIGFTVLIIIGILIIISVNSLVGSYSSSSSYVYNQTWVNFDGIDDFVLVESNTTDTITFWYANETSDWIFVANASGTLYVNAALDTPQQYPVYYNGSSYFLGMENETVYFNGSIDEFRIYEEELNITEIGGIYNDGR